MTNLLIEGDPLEPSSMDLIAQFDTLMVGEALPDGWRVLTGNERYSKIARIAYRFEIEDEV